MIEYLFYLDRYLCVMQKFIYLFAHFCENCFRNFLMNLTGEKFQKKSKTDYF